MWLIGRASFWTGLIAILAYWDWAALNGTYVYDDAGSVLKNVVVVGQVPWEQVFTRDFWGTEMKDETSHKSFRPITTLTFKLNYVFAEQYKEEGEKYPAAFSFRVVNVLLHGIVTSLVTEASMFVFGTYQHVHTIIPPLLVGFLFGLHPVHAEVVSNVTSRGEMLMSIFNMLSFLSYAYALSAHQKYGTNRFRSLFFVYIFPWLFMSLSLFSKEQGGTTLITLVLYDFLNEFGSVAALWNYLMSNQGEEKGKEKRTKAMQFIFRTFILAAQTIIIMLFRISLNGETRPDFIEDQNPAGFAPDRFTRAFSVSWVYCLYIRDAIYPFYLGPDWSGLSIDLISTPSDYRTVIVICLWYFSATSFWSMIVGSESKENDDNDKKEESTGTGTGTGTGNNNANRTTTTSNNNAGTNNNNNSSSNNNANVNVATTTTTTTTTPANTENNTSTANANANAVSSLPDDASGSIISKRDADDDSYNKPSSITVHIVDENGKRKRRIKKKTEDEEFKNPFESFFDDWTVRRCNMAIWAFTFSPFLLSSNILVVIGLMKADRVIYLPLLGFCILETLFLMKFIQSTTALHPGNFVTKRDYYFWFSHFFIVFQLIVLTGRTHERNLAWSDSLRLWSAAYAVNPKSHHTMYNYGYELSIKQRYKEAEYVMRPIGNPHVDGPSNTFVYAMVLFNLGRCTEVHELLDEAFDIINQKRQEGGPRNTPSSLSRSESNLLVARAHCQTDIHERGRTLYQSVQVDPSNDYAVGVANNFMQMLENAGHKLQM